MSIKKRVKLVVWLVFGAIVIAVLAYILWTLHWGSAEAIAQLKLMARYAVSILVVLLIIIIVT